MQQWFVYILASRRNGTLYTGITNNLARRVDEHVGAVVLRFFDGADARA